MMEAKGEDLIFISRILRDGSGVEMISKDEETLWRDTIFKINCLSITQGTYIASEFNSYVVKFKTAMK